MNRLLYLKQIVSSLLSKWLTWVFTIISYFNKITWTFFWLDLNIIRLSLRFYWLRFFNAFISNRFIFLGRLFNINLFHIRINEYGWVILKFRRIFGWTINSLSFFFFILLSIFFCVLFFNNLWGEFFLAFISLKQNWN